MRIKLSAAVVALLFVAVASAWGQLFTEDFTGLTNGNLGTQNSWVQNGTGTDVQVNDTSPISYSGYAGGSGKYVTIATLNGTDPHHTFTGQSTTSAFTLWYAFIINVSSAPSTTGDYFLTLRNTANTTYGGRVFAKQGSSSSKVCFGISKGSAAADGYSADFDIGVNYLIVVKYMSKSGTSNDSMYLWVNPTLSSEPSIASATVSHNPAQADPGWGTTVNAIMIHQRSATASIAASLDGIRVGNNWTDIVPAVSGGSDVTISSGSEPASISALIDADSEKILNFDFRVRDDSTGDDAINTLIDKIVITKGTGNDITDWSAVIAGVKLFDGSADSASGTIYADSMVFSGIDHSSGKLGEVTDNGSKSYQLKLWFKNELGSLKATVDNGNLAFKVDRTSFTVDAAGTPFASGTGTAVESGASNNAVSVTATALNISTQPSASVDVSVDFGLSVEAADSNGNRDLDAASNVTLALLGGTGNLTSVLGLSQNLSSGIKTWSDLQYDQAESGLSIEASASGLIPDTTITFAAIGGAPTVQASDIVFSEVSENQMIISWTNGNGSARIVLIQQGSAVDSDPLDGVSYFPSSTYGMGQQIGDGNYTVYSASGNTDTILGLAPNTIYHFAVYEYNGSGGTENYLTASPAVGSQTTTEHFDAGDYRSLKTGNWSDLSSWETYNGLSWETPSQPPCSTNSIILRSTDTITVDAASSCKNISFLGASFGTRLDISDYTLSVFGLLNADGVTLNDYLIRCSSGRLKFVGGQRTLFGENWGAYGTRWRMEVALASGDTGSATKNIKASDLIFTSGVFKGLDVRPDSGTASTGTLTIASGATLIARSISRTSTATAPCRKVMVNGILGLTGSNVSGDSILINNGAYLRSLSTTGQIVSGVLQYDPGSTLEYAATASQHTRQELLQTVPNILVNNSAGVTMDTTTVVTGTITMNSGNLNTGVDSLVLGSLATIAGEQTGRYVIGKLLTSRLVGTGNTDFGGIGVSLNAGSDDLGLVNVTRISGSAGRSVASITGTNADTSIARRWNISAANPPLAGRNLTLSWVSDDDNGRDLTTAQLWKSLDGGSTWTATFTPHDVSTTRSIMENVTSFSTWTVSDAANPLPVQLASFVGTFENNQVTLKWETSYEVGTDKWLIERASNSERGYAQIAQINAYGQPHIYQWADGQAVYNASYYYRLAQVDRSGDVVYYGPVMVSIGSPEVKIAKLLFCGPSPFTTSANISYQVGRDASEVELVIYNMVGQTVYSRNIGTKDPGEYQTSWNGCDDQGRRLPTGVYFANLRIGHNSFMRKLTLLR